MVKSVLEVVINTLAIRLWYSGN